MGKLVEPRTFMIGCSGMIWEGMGDYLTYTRNQDFRDSIEAARGMGISEGEILCSFFAKLCYKALTLGKNANVERIRDIPGNLQGCMHAGHSSVFGHCSINFVSTNVSRVLTHELVRNHIGTEFSQTSGRYVRLDSIDLVWDPILDSVRHLFLTELGRIEDTIYLAECELGLRRRPPDNPVTKEVWLGSRQDCDRWIPDTETHGFDQRKKITSALRRIAPNGLANEIGWSINLRALRHVIQMRTAAGAEWEIRLLFNQVYDLVVAKYPMIFCDAKITTVDGLRVISGMKTQPYMLMS